MECLVMPIVRWRSRRYTPLTHSASSSSSDLITVVVGKENRVFLVDPFVLDEHPFRILMDLVRRGENSYDDGRWGVVEAENGGRRRVVFVDVDAILFEHMLWLLHNDCSSLLKLNVEEIIDFYAQDC
ncbi:hypothetical protein Sjap_004394 [Stephania japonica]|uniref:Uncharacterized protein n=1 Tax=Stephania japonica TaxID=461633 RepID=A0AAP0PKW0_9MAGN